MEKRGSPRPECGAQPHRGPGGEGGPAEEPEKGQLLGRENIRVKRASGEELHQLCQIMLMGP